jgi:hypothetical protein
MHANLARWREERALVIEEMSRTIRFFKFYHHHWLQKGDAAEASQRHGHAAYARK